ncbi:MAG: deoxyuridine 5'-triphosphate nucleotidohydrolase [Candidatus Bathyarchaeota archaeon]|nr:MAG: deoxyuridine 5'-triphosphate nucleotidohydrolase [Candidatus Bathyarchaeota archaeon]
MLLNKDEIRALIEEQGLISNYNDLDTQLQPAGFDLTLREVYSFAGSGSVDFSNLERVIAGTEPFLSDFDGWYWMPEGSYIVVYNEEVRMPLDVAALARTRSTLLRNGAVIETAVWDPGYKGRSSSLLVVHNPYGIRFKKDARIAQLIFFRILEVGEGYGGAYQNERLKKSSS